LTILKAALNFAFDEKHVNNRDAWGRRVKPFKNVKAARIRYLSITESTRLINACDADFRAVVRAALESGARYGELIRARVGDFNPDAGTFGVPKSKSAKARQIVLTPEGASFFKSHCAGRAGSQLLFRKADGDAWKKSQQKRPIAESCVRAKIMPPINFHGLRHTWASHAVMNGVPLMIVAKNLGHADTKMVEEFYGHLAPSYITDAIRAGAPRFDVEEQGNVVALK
jgi:integrase